MAWEDAAQAASISTPRKRSMTETIVSGIAATLTTAAFVPQAYKIIQSRETAGISLWMHVSFAVGVAFWFVLGVLIWNWPMMIANAVTFMLTLVIVGMKLYLK
jgi:MtN3 and saliva related transmembrane protein